MRLHHVATQVWKRLQGKDRSIVTLIEKHENLLCLVYPVDDFKKLAMLTRAGLLGHIESLQTCVASGPFCRLIFGQRLVELKEERLQRALDHDLNLLMKKKVSIAAIAAAKEKFEKAIDEFWSEPTVKRRATIYYRGMPVILKVACALSK